MLQIAHIFIRPFLSANRKEQSVHIECLYPGIGFRPNSKVYSFPWQVFRCPV